MAIVGNAETFGLDSLAHIISDQILTRIRKQAIPDPESRELIVKPAKSALDVVRERIAILDLADGLQISVLETPEEIEKALFKSPTKGFFITGIAHFSHGKLKPLMAGMFETYSDTFRDRFSYVDIYDSSSKNFSLEQMVKQPMVVLTDANNGRYLFKAGTEIYLAIVPALDKYYQDKIEPKERQIEELKDKKRKQNLSSSLSALVGKRVKLMKAINETGFVLDTLATNAVLELLRKKQVISKGTRSAWKRGGNGLEIRTLTPFFGRLLMFEDGTFSDTAVIKKPYSEFKIYYPWSQIQYVLVNGSRTSEEVRNMIRELKKAYKDALIGEVSRNLSSEIEK